jgi:hypothetical protein
MPNAVELLHDFHVVHLSNLIVFIVLRNLALSTPVRPKWYVVKTLNDYDISYYIKNAYVSKRHGLNSPQVGLWGDFSGFDRYTKRYGCGCLFQ